MFRLVNLGAAVQKLRHRVEVAGPCRSVKWEFRIQVFLEQRDDGRTAPDFCDTQRRMTVLRHLINVRAVVQQQPRSVDVALLANHVQQRPAVLVRLVNLLRAFLQQQPCRVDVVLLAGDEQRRRTVLIRPIDLRAFVQQQPHHVDVAVLAGDV